MHSLGAEQERTPVECPSTLSQVFPSCILIVHFHSTQADNAEAGKTFRIFKRLDDNV